MNEIKKKNARRARARHSVHKPEYKFFRTKTIFDVLEIFIDFSNNFWHLDANCKNRDCYTIVPRYSKKMKQLLFAQKIRSNENDERKKAAAAAMSFVHQTADLFVCKYILS